MTYAEKLRSVLDAAALVAEMDQAVAACDAAIVAGRRRVDMPAVVVKMPSIVTKYDATSTKTKTDLANAIKAAQPSDPKTGAGGTKV